MKTCFTLLFFIGVVYSASIQRIPQPLEQKAPIAAVQDVFGDLGMEDAVQKLHPTPTTAKLDSTTAKLTNTPEPTYRCVKEFNQYHCQGCFYDYRQHQCCCALYQI